MKNSLTGSVATTLALVLVRAARDSSPTQSSSAAPPKPELQFVDLQGFDRDLG